MIYPYNIKERYIHANKLMKRCFLSKIQETNYIIFFAMYMFSYFFYFLFFYIL